MTQTIYSRIGRRIRRRRIELAMTQQHVAERIGLTRGSIANIEAGRQQMLLHTAKAFAKVLKTSEAALLEVRT